MRLQGIRVGLGVLLLTAVALLLIYGQSLLQAIPSRYWGLVPIAFAFGVIVAASGQPNPLIVARGVDNRLSLSQFQILLWTIVVLYVYSGLFVHNVRTHLDDRHPFALAPIQFPQSVLLLLGFSVTTLVGAAGITSSQVGSGTLVKSISPKTDLSLKWLIARDDGSIDLTRFQVLLWTLIAAAVFLGGAFVMATHQRDVSSLPEIGNALVLLMGVGQAAYIGGKLVVTPGRPLIYRLSRVLAYPGNTITITGSGFGKPDPGSALLINGASISVPDAQWSDASITFSVPALQPWDQAPWPDKPSEVHLQVAVGALQSDPCALQIADEAPVPSGRLVGAPVQPLPEPPGM